MKRIAIIGGGISGLTAAYELELARKRGADIDWHLYEATDRLGGIIETTRHTTPEGEWILEGGPDGWVSEKPWARELAIELGLEDELIYSNDADRKTYIYLDGKLQAMPDRMRMFVPEDLSTLEVAPLFSDVAREAYANEITRADELKASAPDQDESVASFVHRHFGDEVLESVAAPLLSGILGGDIHKLSVCSVLAPFVTMEREHGSLVLALQLKYQPDGQARQPIFTSLEHGMASLTDALQASLPSERLHLECAIEELWDDPRWRIVMRDPTFKKHSIPQPLCWEPFDELILSGSRSSAWWLMPAGDHCDVMRELLPKQASSALLVTFCWQGDRASDFALPAGFGFLVPQRPAKRKSTATVDKTSSQILATTFTSQKFPRRTPPKTRAVRVFFGSGSTEQFITASEGEVATEAFAQLQGILGPLPEPDHSLTTVRRWPHSLPQCEVGHLDRMAKLDKLVAEVPGLHLLGNSYRGVGLPDLIRDARATARKILSTV